jgi:NTP pyrophosphatase (non-canonical NTP hydrolase)
MLDKVQFAACKVAEEASEVAEAAAKLAKTALKLQQFGPYASKRGVTTNWEELQQEAVDLTAMLQRLACTLGCEFTVTESGINAKAAKVDKYHAVSVAEGMSEPASDLS